MIWTEMKSNPHKVAESITQAFKSLYDQKDGYFVSNSGVQFSLHVMGDASPWDFIVIEYQDTGEDGDAFYPSDFDSLDSIISAMKDEIEGV